MKKRILLLLILFFAVSVNIAFAKTTYSYMVKPKIVSVIDGDTIRIWLKDNNANVRLKGIDCYETSENSRIKYQRNTGLMDEEIFRRGKEAKYLLISKLRAHKDIFLEITDVDKRYGRLVGIFYYKNSNGNYVSINNEMAATEYCSVYNFRQKRY